MKLCTHCCQEVCCLPADPSAQFEVYKESNTVGDHGIALFRYLRTALSSQAWSAPALSSEYLWFFKNEDDRPEEAELVQKAQEVTDKLVDVQTRLELQQLLADALPIIGEEYKFHLQPKREFLYSTLKRLDTLSKYIATIKVAIDEAQTLANHAPLVVVYVYRGRAVAQEFMLQAMDLFSDVTREQVHLITPRFNQRLTWLLYYANSSANLKYAYQELIERNGWPNEHFDDEYIAFYGQHLDVPR